MKRTEVIKKAINARVVVQFYDDEEAKGWLVVDSNIKKQYLLLPFKEHDYATVCETILSLRVSHIKHLTYISNGYRLW